MKVTALLFVTVALSPALTVAQTQTQWEDLRLHLSEMIDEYEEGWEPQRLASGEFDLEEMLARSIRPFANSPETRMVFDGTHYTYDEHVSTLREDLLGFIDEIREGHHRVIHRSMLPLNDSTVVATEFYRFEFVETSGRRGSQLSTFTAVFISTDAGWKIVQYHGAHGPKEYETG